MVLRLAGEEITNKKIEALRRRRDRWVKDIEGKEGNVKAYYEIHAKIIEYDIEDAVKYEAKRRVRLSLKRIKKRLAEVEELRGVVDELLDDKVLGWTEYVGFKDELEKVFDLRLLRFGEKR